MPVHLFSHRYHLLNSLFFQHFVHTYIIYFHRSGEGRFVDTFLSAPVAAYSNIQQQVKALIKGPYLRSSSFMPELEYQLIINITADSSGCPVYPVKMELRSGIADPLDSGLLCIDLEVIFLGVSSNMDVVKIIAYMLHNIDLAGFGPAAICPIGRQHPDGRPGASGSG